jgi:hypothetical protein
LIIIVYGFTQGDCVKPTNMVVVIKEQHEKQYYAWPVTLSNTLKHLKISTGKAELFFVTNTCLTYNTTTLKQQ